MGEDEKYEKDRYKSIIAVLLVLTRDKEDGSGKEILLQKRQNTGWMDDMYDLCVGGHLEKGELIKEGMVRETREEICINVDTNDLNLVNVLYDINPDGISYLNFYFAVKKYGGEIKIGEPEKCSELLWADINNLPDNLISKRKIVISNILDNVMFDERRS